MTWHYVIRIYHGSIWHFVSVRTRRDNCQISGTRVTDPDSQNVLRISIFNSIFFKAWWQPLQTPSQTLEHSLFNALSQGNDSDTSPTASFAVAILACDSQLFAHFVDISLDCGITCLFVLCSFGIGYFVNCSYLNIWGNYVNCWICCIREVPGTSMKSI